MTAIDTYVGGIMDMREWLMAFCIVALCGNVDYIDEHVVEHFKWEIQATADGYKEQIKFGTTVLVEIYTIHGQSVKFSWVKDLEKVLQ